MLDVHPPHAAAHTWRDFFIHIATIVVGLLIAVGLEQTVEYFHRRHERNELQEALRVAAKENEDYIDSGIVLMEKTINWAEHDADATEQAGPTGRLTMHRMPAGNVYVTNAGVWIAARSNGAASLLPAGQQNWFEDLNRLQDQIFGSASGTMRQYYAACATLNQAIAGHVVEVASGDLDLSSLNPAQRNGAIDALRALAERARGVLGGLIFYRGDSEYIFSTPPDKLGDPDQLKRFFAADHALRQSHPDLRYRFSAK